MLPRKVDENGRVWLPRPENQPYVPEEHSEQELREIGIVFLENLAFIGFPDLSCVAYSDAIKVENGKIVGWTGNIAFWFENNSNSMYVPCGYDKVDSMFRDCLYHIAKGDYDEWKNEVEYILGSRDQAEEILEAMKCLGPSAAAFVAPRPELH